MFVNGLSAVAHVCHGADDEKCGKAIESEDFAGDEDGSPECIACACEHGGKAECCGEGDGHPEHACDEDSEGCADGEKRGDDSADESGGERENRDGKLYNPVISGNPGGTRISNDRGVTGSINPKTQIQQVCSKSSVASLEKYEQQSAYSNAHNGDSLDVVRELLSKKVLRESEELCKSAADNSEEYAHQRKLHEELSVERAFVRENACRKSARIEKRTQVHAELVESEHA